MNTKKVDVIGIRNNQNEMILGVGTTVNDFVVLSKVFERKGYINAIAFDGTVLKDAEIVLEAVKDFDEVKIPCSQIRAIYYYNNINVANG